MTLTERQSRILELVVREYVETAAPVGSQLISRKHRLDSSPATIRNEMAELEDGGYLTHPHTSSGRVPTDKGYRFYVEALMREEELPWEAQQTIRHQFHQLARGHDDWLHLAASVLAKLAENVAVVTVPRTQAAKVKHMELVSLHDRTALLVLVLDQGRLEQQLLTLDEEASQEELHAIAGRLIERLAGRSMGQIESRPDDLTPMEAGIFNAVRSLMQEVDEGFDEAYLEGLRNILEQPEFAQSERALGLLELLQERTLVRTLPLRTLARQGVNVIIGAGAPELAEAGEAMRACSVVVGSYGAADAASGVVAVLGPTRMRYSRTIPTVRYLSELMSELLAEYYE
jgi:heat-inducible transcriptional repressor